MEDKDAIFKENVKLSFKKVKEDIFNFKQEIEELKQTLNRQKEEYSRLLEEIKGTKPLNEEKRPEKADLKQVPQEAKGSSYSFIHSNIHSFIHSLDKQAFNDMNKNLKAAFLSLTKQEFITFLTIYQLEEDLKRPVSYNDIASHLNLSTGCIRTYISSLLKKNTPIIKEKANNKIVYLSILPDFKDLNLKSKLTDLFYNKDPNQRKLF